MITVTILTKNSSKYLNEVLKALSSFDEVLVYDTGSTDQTISIAEKFANVKFYKAPFEGFGPTHNKASKVAKHDWILSIDSDEVVSKELALEIQSLDLSEDTVYSISRRNYYRGKWIKWCGWYPDRQTKLYNRKRTAFTNAQVHEEIISHELQIVPLKSPLIHYPYSSTADFLNKMQIYSELFAKQYQNKKKSSLSIALGHAIFTFFKSYVIKCGFLGGAEGFIISVYNANTAFYKYLKLAEINEKELC